MNLDAEHFLFAVPARPSETPPSLYALDAVIGLLQDWQTLTAALIALIAAAWHARILQRQIRSAEHLEQSRCDRRFRAKRALLPAYLDVIVDHCRTWARSLQELHQTVSAEVSGRRSFGAGSLSYRRLPREVFVWLESFIEAADDRAGRPVIDLIRDIQVVDARMAMLLRDRAPLDVGPLPVDIRSRIVEVAAIYAAVERWYDYGRGGAPPDPGPPKKDAVTNALKLLDFFDQLDPQLFEHLEKVGVTLPSGRI